MGCLPLLTASGTKYKVLEALSAGVPLLCSPLARHAWDAVLPRLDGWLERLPSLPRRADRLP